jgi:hypothetical protein
MKAIERHRQNWQGKSDEWLFERLDNELKQKIQEIHRLIAENESLRKSIVCGSLPTDEEINEEAYKTWKTNKDLTRNAVRNGWIMSIIEMRNKIK